MSNQTDKQTIEQMQAEIARLQKENATLATKKATGLTCKVTEKGGVSVYGMGRFPVTLYASQWDKLLSHVEDIKAFIETNRDKLAEKPQRANAVTELGNIANATDNVDVA